MRRLIYKLLLFTPVIFLVIFINYLVDPGKLIDNQYIEGIARLLIESKNVENIGNYDERILQREYISLRSSPINTVVLGSSRVMMIGNNLFDGSVMNNAVSGASIEDMMSIYWMYRKKRLLPDTLVVGVDPWMLNRNSDQTRYLSLKAEYNEICEHLKIADEMSAIDAFGGNKYWQLIDFSYFQESVKYFWSNFNKPEKLYFPTEKSEGEAAIKLFDGRISYDAAFRNADSDLILAKAMEYSDTYPIYSLENFDEIDKSLASAFELFMRLVKSDGIDIILVMSPYHPYAYGTIQKDTRYKMVEEVEKYFTEFSKIENIPIYGSYDPMRLELMNDDFYDGMHPKPDAFKKIFKNVF